MTTIIYRDGVMAGDGMSQYGNMNAAEAQKVFKLDSGVLVGFAGMMHQCQAFVRHLANPEVNPLPHMDQMRALVVFPDDPRMICEFAHENVPSYIKTDHAAIGSGDQIAMTLMRRSSLSATEVMRLVVDLDVNTGPPIHYESLHEPRRMDVSWLLRDRFHPTTIAPQPRLEVTEEEYEGDRP